MKVRMMIWGRPFNLEVTSYDEDGNLTEKQQQTLDEFLEDPKLISESLEPTIAYLHSLQQQNKEENHDTGYEDAVITKENIFSFAEPECISMPDEDDQVLLMFRTPLDPEEGFAVCYLINIQLIEDLKAQIKVMGQSEAL